MRKMAVLALFSCTTLSLLLSGCGAMQRPEQGDNYERTKEMVVDILQTEEGKKAVRELLKDPEIKQEILMNDEQIKTVIVESLTGPQSKDTWGEVIKDPKFAAELGKTLQEEHKKLLKDLMKDPEYRGMMMEILQDPEFEKQLTNLMKSKAYRQQTVTIMKESLQSPMLQEEMLQLMMKAQEEATKPKKEGQQGDSGKGGSQGGEGSGSGS